MWYLEGQEDGDHFCCLCSGGVALGGEGAIGEAADDVGLLHGGYGFFDPGCDLCFVGEGNGDVCLGKSDAFIVGVAFDHDRHFLAGDVGVGGKLGVTLTVNDFIGVSPVDVGFGPVGVGIGKNAVAAVGGKIVAGGIGQNLYKLTTGNLPFGIKGSGRNAVDDTFPSQIVNVRYIPSISSHIGEVYCGSILFYDKAHVSRIVICTFNGKIVPQSIGLIHHNKMFCT